MVLNMCKNGQSIKAKEFVILQPNKVKFLLNVSQLQVGNKLSKII